MGIVLVAFMAARTCGSPPATTMIINLETHQLGRKLRKSIALPLRISVLDGDVLSFYVAKLTQSCRIASDLGDSRVGLPINRYPYPRDFLRLLRLGYHSKNKQYHCNKD